MASLSSSSIHGGGRSNRVFSNHSEETRSEWPLSSSSPNISSSSSCFAVDYLFTCISPSSSLHRSHQVVADDDDDDDYHHDVDDKHVHTTNHQPQQTPQSFSTFCAATLAKRAMCGVTPVGVGVGGCGRGVVSSGPITDFTTIGSNNSIEDDDVATTTAAEDGGSNNGREGPPSTTSSVDSPSSYKAYSGSGGGRGGVGGGCSTPQRSSLRSHNHHQHRSSPTGSVDSTSSTHLVSPKRVSFSASTPAVVNVDANDETATAQQWRHDRRQHRRLQRKADQHREYLARMHGVCVIRGKSHDHEDPYNNLNDFVDSAGHGGHGVVVLGTASEDLYHYHHRADSCGSQSIDPVLFLP
jgi:hypothetical protein